MQKLVLCDNGNYTQTAALSRRYHASINTDAFYLPESEDADPDEIKRCPDAYDGLPLCAMHGTFADLCFGSADALIADATRRRFEYAYQTAQKLKVRHIVLHHGYVPGVSHPPNWLRRGKVFREQFLADKPDDTVFCIENLLEDTPGIDWQHGGSSQ